MKRMILLTVSIAIALVLIAACTQVTPTGIEPSVDNGEALIISKCSDCHSTDRVFQANKTEAEWETTITRMIGLGADVTEEEQTEMIDWLVSQND